MSIWKSTIVSSSFAALLAVGVSQVSAEDESLQTMFKGWVEESSKLVSSNMDFSVSALQQRDDKGIQFYRVTVDADGKIQNHELIARKGKLRLERASERTINKLESFPGLPKDYYSDELTFVLIMDYAASKRMTKSAWDTFHATRTEIFDVTGNPLPNKVVMLGVGVSQGR